MRTRFLGTEFCRSFPIGTSDFFRCFLPQLLPANGSSQGELPYSFNDVPVFNISLKIEKLQTDDCLSKFLSDVLPQKFDVDIGDLVSSESGSAIVCIDERSCGIEEENGDTFTAEEINNLGSRTEKDKTDLLVTEKNDLESLYFEIPEVDPLSVTQDHDIQIQMEDHMNLLEIANDVDTLDMPTFEIRQQDFLGIIQELVSVDNITDSFIETKTDPTEDSSSTELDSPPTFLHFEVDEACMGIFSDTPIECTLTTLLHIEFQKVTEYDDTVNNEVEFPRLQTFDLLEYLSASNLELQGYNVELPPSNFFADLSFIDQPEGLQPEHMLNQPGKSDNNFVSSEGMLLFEDFQFIELELCSLSEVSANVAMVVKIEACDDMFGEAMKFRSFNELIVCNELTLSDNLFKALPVPILSDCHILRSLESFVQESLKDLDLEFPSMFDGLYLDWYVLEEENNGHSTYSSCWKTMVEKDMNIICTALDSLDYEVLILNFVLADDKPDQKELEDKKEMLNVPFCDSSVPWISTTQRGRDQGEIESAKVLVSINSMAQGSDDFFLNPQTCVRGLNDKAFEPSLDTSKPLSVDCSKDSMAACASPELPLRRWNIKLRRIKLSDEIVGILNSFRRNFLVMLEDDKGSKVDMFSSHGLDDDLSLFRSPKEKLMKQIENESATGSGKSILLAAVCAFKQMAWYLCYYGYRSSYIYIRNFLEGMQCLKYRLSFLQNWTEEMCGRAEKEVVKFHPSLPVIKEFLELNVIQNGKKMLIVAELFFRWPLKRLLESMKISYDEPPDFSAYTHEGNEWIDRADVKNINFQSDCCLLSHEYMDASFPYGKFHSVLEYGGPCESSRISMISPELDDFPFLHFLKVDFEDSALAEALCHGVDMPKHVGKMNDGCHSISMMSKTKNNVIELLNFIPFENFKTEPKGAINESDAFSTMQVPQSLATDSEKIKGKKLNFTLSEDFKMEQKGAEDSDDAFSAMQVPQSLIAESENINGNKPGFLDTVIVVNTQNLDKEMIISRRSTYQKILAMEKRGVQVVERDLNLPVDILVDAAVCMVWYDVKNIRNKASASDEAFSSLPLCIENIAASILTSLSFAFSSCILIFEGEKSFIAGVMESSDELYAAAASLGIDLQIFYSYSSETTDKIILSTIETSAINTEPSSSYPKMFDSESLAESFLTAFPSLNPLSAHAILSCGATLAEFLECSHDCRVQALQKYKVPDEAISLFTLLAKYGEREDSKSALTDSSSSVTYGPGNHKYHMESYPENKKRKLDEDLLDVDICPKKTNFEPIACPDDLWKSESLDEFVEFRKPRLSFDAELFAQKEEFDANMLSGEMKKWDDSWNKIVSDETETTWDKTPMKKLKQQKLTNSWNQIDKGEVIDIDSFSHPNSFDFCNPYSVKREIGKDSSERTRGVARKLFSSSNSLSGFPVSDPSKLDKKGPTATDRNYLDSGLNKYNLSSSHKGHIIEDTVHTAVSNPREHLTQERECLSETPLWNAVNSSQCIGKSPWTMEFLNGVRAKSKSREQSLPPELLGSRNVSKAVKRRSPSIIEFYKYQGDHHVGKTEQQQRKKQPVQAQGSSKSKVKTTSDPTPPTWTPLDKRAKRTLSFTTTGNGAQSKLIWGDRKFQTRMM